MSIHERLGYNFPQEHTIIQLVNMNSTCYINSVLQSLFNIPSIQNYLEDVSRITKEVDISIEQTLFGLFVKIYIDSQRAPQNEVWYEPNYFLDKLFNSTNTFKRYEMGDAYELFLTLLRIFDDEIVSINRAINSIRNSPRKDDIFNRNNPIHCFSSFFDFNTENKRNPKFPYYRTPDLREVFNLIPIKPNTNGVEKAIQEFTENPYYRKFLSLPEILVVKVNVFGIENGNYHKVFVKTPISIQLELSTNKSENMKNDNFQAENAIYDLISILMHIGTDFSSGHFMTVFNACDRIIVGDDANFWGLNDEQLGKFLDQNEIPGSETCSSVYMMFYQKRKRY